MEFRVSCICIKTPGMKHLLLLPLFFYACAQAPQNTGKSQSIRHLHLSAMEDRKSEAPLETIEVKQSIPVPLPSEYGMVEEPVEYIEFPEIEPVFPGGPGEMYRYFGKNTLYPQVASEMHVEGTVYVQFKVMQDGSIEEVTVVRGVHESLDKEAMRVVRSMPKWAPAEAEGRKISKIVVAPFRFKII